MAKALASFHALIVFFAVFSSCLESAAPASSRALVPAIYVFGDSTVDVGNNNYLFGDIAKANFPPYGIDFPLSHPTGRFSNGLNSADFIARQLGFKRSPPPFLLIKNITRHVLLTNFGGANFASAGSGILDSTGSEITMRSQIQNFEAYRSEIIAQIGGKETKQLLSKALFFISTGGNDLFAFFRQNTVQNNTTNISTFIESLTSNYRYHIQELHRLGARKFGISDVGPIGCCPISRALNPLGDCVEEKNQLTKTVNNAFKAFLIDIKPKLHGMTFSLGRIFDLLYGIISKPGKLEVRSCCCGGGRFNAEQACSQNATLCDEREKFFFWDAIHASQIVTKLAGRVFFEGPKHLVTPINLKQLVMN